MSKNKWSPPIEAMVSRAVVKIEDQYRRVCFNMFKAILERTPIDSGRFLANWNITAAAPDYTYRSNRVDVGRALIELEKVFALPIGKGLFIANGLPYGRKLEYEGWSKQAPRGMIRITLAESKMHIANAKRGVQ